MDKSKLIPFHALKDHFHLFQAAFDSSILIDEQQNVISFNKTAKKYFKDIQVNSKITNFIKFDDESDIFGATLLSGKGQIHRNLSINNGNYIIDISTSPLHDAEVDHVEGAFIFISDQSEKSVIHKKYLETIKWLEEEGEKLQDSNELLVEYERMANASKDGITLIDKEYRYVAANEKYLQKKKMQWDDLIGKTVSEVWGEFVFNKYIKNCIDECSKGNYINTQSWVDFDGTGEESFIDVTYAPFFNLKKQHTHVVVTTHDITELKLKELELQKSLSEAEAAKDAKANFLSNMSHEIRTPMNAIVALSQEMMEADLEHEQKDNVTTISDSAQSLLRIINDILDFSKVEAGKLEIENIDFNLRNCIEQIVKIFNHKTLNSSIEFSTLTKSNVPYNVIGDPGRIKQILVNFINNAIKFTEKGEVTLHMKATEVTHNEVKIKFSVRDTGIGIKEDILNNLFKPFEQAHTSISSKYGGTGLGLSISKQLTELMHGKIGCESKYGEGSTFWFEIPFKTTSEAEKSSTSEQSNKEFSRHIVLYDPQNHSHDQYETFFKSWSYELTHVTSPEQLTEVLNDPARKTQTFIFKEDLDKIVWKSEWLVAIKQKQLRSILITDHGIKGEPKIFEEHGFSAYLTAPLDMNYLIQTLTLLQNNQHKEIITRHALSDISDSSINLLVVDDNKTNLKVANRILQKVGYQVDLAKNGQEAIDICQEKLYHVILMDLRMPEVDGFTAAKTIKANQGPNQTTPIIALTADVTKEVKVQCKETGMADFVSKPFNKKVLIDAVNAAAFSLKKES